MSLRDYALLGLTLASFVPAGAVAAPAGLALVIGNAGYGNLPPLPACQSSASTVAARLTALGYEVVAKNDPSNGAISGALGGFAGELAANPTVPAIIYVCGYGAALNDRDFLLPASARVSRPSDLMAEGVLARMFGAAAAGARAAAGAAPVVVALDLVPESTVGLAAPTGGSEADAPAGSLGLAVAIEAPAPSAAATNFSAALIQALSAPRVPAAGFFAQVAAALPSGGATKLAAVRESQAPGMLIGAAPAAAAQPAAAQPAAAQPAAVQAAAAQPAATQPAAAAGSLPDEDKMSDADRERVQTTLTKLGYYDGQVDGIFGPDTLAAIRRWQHETKAEMTGHLTGAQATALVNARN